jgi:tetratricopeptide (TPR) repeat protein
VEPAKIVTNTRAEVPAGEWASKFELVISVDPAALASLHRALGPTYREGLISRQLGDLEEAESNFKAAIKAKPAFTPAILDLADLYIARGLLDRARGQIEAVLEIDPDNDRARRLDESLR